MVRTPKIVVNRYPSQSYKTIFNQRTGALVRLEDSLGNEPSWCSCGPELVDISRTNWCDKGCPHCYKNSTVKGKHMSLETYTSLLRQLSAMGVLQVALGGGNPNQHPNFVEILRRTREEYNIIPSYTSNGRGLDKITLAASSQYCGAVAVSAYEPFGETFAAVRTLLDNGIRTNVHFLLTKQSIFTAIEWLRNPPEEIRGINAIIFLNYKPVGRNPRRGLLANESSDISTFFSLAGSPHAFKVGFDSCSISGVTKFIHTSPIFLERCEAGRFSMYISEDSNIYPCSFMVGKVEGVPVTSNNIGDVWRKHEAFIRMRGFQRRDACHECHTRDICFGGCPVYPEINLCG